MNYPEILATRFKKLFPKTTIYSNVDPAREWQGVTTIEFAETESTRERYISGATRRVVSLSVAIRAESQSEGSKVGATLKPLLMCILDDMSIDFINDWTIEDEGTTPAYIRPLNGFEQLVFNDYFIVFFSENREYEERYEAGFKAAKMALVGEDNAPLLTDDDKDVIKNASVLPIFRLFNTVLASQTDFDTAKKN